VRGGAVGRRSRSSGTIRRDACGASRVVWIRPVEALCGMRACGNSEAGGRVILLPNYVCIGKFYVCFSK
jgi:hypothetical protein